MLPGKKYTPEDILDIVRRRYWLILIPFAVISAGTAVWARYLPDQYRSETSILVVPQRVSEDIVRPTITARIEDRLNSITQQILSRNRLERIINEFNLYEKERKEGILEDVVQNMRDDIRPEVLRGDAFRISYVGENPRTVMKVTERLATLFIDENMTDRANLAEGTSQFLDQQLENTRRSLEVQEKRLKEYRERYAGQLPSQTESNYQRLQGVQLQLQNLTETMNDDRDRRLTLERQVAEAEQLVDDTPVSPSAAPTEPAGSSTALLLTQERARLRDLEQRYLQTHPEVKKAQRSVKELEQKLAAEPQTVKTADGRTLSPPEIARRRRLDDLRGQLVEIDRVIAKKQAEEVRLRSRAGVYESRLEAAPSRETEMIDISRDYDTLKALYADLSSKKEESKIAANLERRQSGEQFKLLDQARIPERPFSPDRQRINAMGMIVGLALGIGLVALLEYRDKSFKTDEEVMQMLSLPVLAVVPVMKSTDERRRGFRQQIVLGVGLGTTVLACFAVVLYTWVR